MADEVEELRKSLRQQAKQAAEMALRDGGDIPPERLDALRRLQGLIDIADAQHSSPAGNWLPAAALFVSLAVASVLLFIHLPSAEIELDAAVSELSFAMESDGPLIPGINVSEIRVSGAQTVEMPDVSPVLGPRPVSPAAAERIRLTVADAASGSITLSSFAIPKATLVRMAVVAPNRYNVSLQTPSGVSSELHVSCNGEVHVATATNLKQECRFPKHGSQLPETVGAE